MGIRNVMIKAHSNLIELGCDRELIVDSCETGGIEVNWEEDESEQFSYCNMAEAKDE